MLLYASKEVVFAAKDFLENPDREKFLTNVSSSVEHELRKIGLKLINVNVTDTEGNTVDGARIKIYSSPCVSWGATAGWTDFNGNKQLNREEKGNRSSIPEPEILAEWAFTDET